MRFFAALVLGLAMGAGDLASREPAPEPEAPAPGEAYDAPRAVEADAVPKTRLPLPRNSFPFLPAPA
jgi:hypothetical protein